MPGSFDFLHIKRHTKGSSNELSFDVLDAARSNLDDKGRKSSRSPKTPSSAHGNYRGVAGTSTLSAVPEVERRKKARHARAVRVRVIGALLIVAAVGAVGFFAYGYYQKAMDFSFMYASIVDSVSEIDQKLALADEIMQDPLNLTYSERRKQIDKALPDVVKQLEAVQARAEEAGGYTMNDRDDVAVAQLVEAVGDRKLMAEAAEEAFAVSRQHEEELAVAKSAWDAVLAADQLVKEASELSNSAASEDDVSLARQKTQEALDAMAGSLAELEGIESRHPSVSFSAQREYLELRIEALGYAVAASDAVVWGDRESVVYNNDLYNETDRKAAMLVDGLPLSLESQVTEAFEDEISESAESYAKARAGVSSADAYVRSYLNV